jgi:lipoprotein-anchoring transpeptidase ErfK/SrfK
MKLINGLLTTLVIFAGFLLYTDFTISASINDQTLQTRFSYWLLLYRKSNLEFLYYGLPGNYSNSYIIKIFKVKSGVPNERPTPLPGLLGREYWIINNFTPQFLALDIPVSDGPPYGPVSYRECNGQCNWSIPGSFGLHGVDGDMTKLSDDDPGSSGCVRHSDWDIAYLYNLLSPKKEEIRYYIEER